MQTNVSTSDLIDAAMCLWEDVLDSLGRPEREAKRHHLEVQGACSYRGMARLRESVAALAEPCHLAWEHAQRAHGYADSFDWEWCPWFHWEWCPWFLRNCVDWDAVRLRPNWQDIVDAAYSGDREN